MIHTYETRHCKVRDAAGFLTRFPDPVAWIDEMSAELCATLQLAEPLEHRAPLVITEGAMSEVRNGEVVIAPREDDRCGARDWFEILFRHELTHWLTAQGWNSGSLVIFWEGLPIYLADNRVRQRIFGYSYHQFCAALVDCNALLPLHALLLPHQYYGMIHDFRPAAQAGSFTEYLIERHGMTALRQAYETYTPPTPHNPRLPLTALCATAWQQSFSELERAWRDFLSNAVERHPAADALVSRRCYPATVEVRDVHCRFCCTPIPGQTVCPACAADQQIDIRVI